MEETLDLRKVFDILKKRLLLILTILLIGISLTAAVSYYLLTPVYESSSQILVNREGVGSLANEDIETDLQLINTYSVIINSPVILEQVIEELNLNMTVEELNEKIIVTSASESQVIDISVRDQDPKTAAAIVNAIADIFEDEIQEIMNVNNVTILSLATVKENQSPVAPNIWLNLAIAAGVGLLLGVGLAFLLDYLDTTVKNQRDVKRLLDVPVLAMISTITTDDKPSAKSKLALKEKEA
ncbi:YveK family protein [Planococcus sp. 1R117A]|uniref:YveK family protein n=1 Tax=Planococcus sp. 1R117A TaxID=3447020 RepID=UPI003EDC03A8